MRRTDARRFDSGATYGSRFTSTPFTSSHSASDNSATRLGNRIHGNSRLPSAGDRKAGKAVDEVAEPGQHHEPSEQPRQECAPQIGQVHREPDAIQRLVVEDVGGRPGRITRDDQGAAHERFGEQAACDDQPVQQAAQRAATCGCISTMRVDMGSPPALTMGAP